MPQKLQKAYGENGKSVIAKRKLEIVSRHSNTG
jgi:hypothetical protein